MNILLVDQYDDLGGAQHCLLDVAGGILDRRWQAFAALPGDGPLAVELTRRDIPVTRIRLGPFSAGRKTGRDVSRFAGQTPNLVRRLRGLIETRLPDLVYVNGPRPLLAACAAARGLAPVLFHCHSLLGPGHARLAAWSLRIPTRSMVVAASRFVAEPLAAHLPAAHVRVVYNGAGDYSTTVRREAGGPRRVAMIGRIAPEKGQLEFLHAIRLLAADPRDVRFVIQGAPLFSSAESARYAALARRQAQGLPVEIQDWTHDIKDLLSQIDLLVVPSVGPECTPRIILEAYSAGVPVVAFRTGGIPEIVQHGETGYLVDAPTAEALAACLRGLLGGPADELAGVATRARAAWETRFNAARFRREILAAMEELAPRRDGHRRAAS